MRLDKYLTENKYVDSRTRAEKLILSGNVIVDGQRREKPSFDIDESIIHSIEILSAERYVSRGGLKLEGALDAFSIDVSGLDIIDVGASTGGFTHCLLERGAKSVISLDSGHGQLHPKIRDDARVRVIEGYNARSLNSADVGILDGAVMDVSFISQTLILPALAGVIRDGGFYIGLIKPQFEAGRGAIGKNGIVKKAADREAAVCRVLDSAHACGLRPARFIKSPIEGGDGNIEYLALFIKESGDPAIDKNTIKKICEK